MDKRFEELGIRPADILLPGTGTDMSRWAVVACDQFTSQPEYWEEGGPNSPATPLPPCG